MQENSNNFVNIFAKIFVHYFTGRFLANATSVLGSCNIGSKGLLCVFWGISQAIKSGRLVVEIDFFHNFAH